MSRSVEMEEAEEVLSRAMVATITGTRPQVTADEVAQLLCSTFGFEDGDFTTHLHKPEDFLIIFGSRASKDRMNGDHFIRSQRFSLSLRPWCKLAHAGSGGFEYRVELELRGIPANAWHLATAEHILGASVWIERLHPSTRSRADLATFRLSGRAHDPAAILEIVEVTPGPPPPPPPPPPHGHHPHVPDRHRPRPR
uniref:DUF4283 domain-containing protein n=1 Tax=Aegilops tauschii subsp. strangulata TaxID=200361 RepID=A0A453BYC6_AEGTS